jgi:hypothetical protein
MYGCGNKQYSELIASRSSARRSPFQYLSQTQTLFYQDTFGRPSSLIQDISLALPTMLANIVEPEIRLVDFAGSH